MIMRTASLSSKMSRDGYVLVAVLIVLVVLTLAAYRYSDLMISEYRATDRIFKNVEAKALADAGIHYTMAQLADPNAFATNLGGNPYYNQGVFQNASVNIAGAQGNFSIMSVDYAADTGSGMVPLRYGVTDEAGRINVNAIVQRDPSPNGVAYTTLMGLPGMTDDVAYAIIDWIDADNNVTSNGAEDSYYMALSPPYHCKNAPLNSIEELLLVRGVTPLLLFGNDLNRNGMQDPEEESGGTFNYGWAPFLTIYSHESLVSSTGSQLYNLNDKNIPTLYQNLKATVGDQLAAYIIGYRIYSLAPASSSSSSNQSASSSAGGGQAGQLSALVQKVEQDLAASNPPSSQRNISSIYSLIGTSINVTSQQQGASGGTTSTQKSSSNGTDKDDGTGSSKSTSSGGQSQTKTVTTTYTCPIADPGTARQFLPAVLLNTTTQSASKPPLGRINVNTATMTVISTLPGLNQTDIAAIVAAQQSNLTSSQSSDPVYQTTAWLYTDAQITAAKMAALDSYITATTQVYRIQSIGYFAKGGPVARVEAVVDINQGQPRILYYRDLTDLGRAIDPRNN